GQAPRPRHRHLQRAAWGRVLLHALAVGTEMDRQFRRNRLDRAEGALTDAPEFRPVYAGDGDNRSGSRSALGTDHRLLGKEGSRITGGRGEWASRPWRAREDIRRGQGRSPDPAY